MISSSIHVVTRRLNKLIKGSKPEQIKGDTDRRTQKQVEQPNKKQETGRTIQERTKYKHFSRLSDMVRSWVVLGCKNVLGYPIL